MNIHWAPTPNIGVGGRKGRKPIAIVDHITAGSFPGCLNWMQNPVSQASAHFLVTQAGEIYQLADDENDRTWHAGEVRKPSWSLYDGTNPNYYTIGIEHEGFDGSLTEAQYQATLWLHRMLCQKWGIVADSEHIIGHYRIDAVNRVNCPGPNFPWNRLFADLNGVSQYPPVNIIISGQVFKGYHIVFNGQDRACAMAAQVAQAFGLQFEWQGDTNTLLILPFNGPAYGYTSDPKVIVNGQIIPAINIHGHNYVPVGLIGKALGRQVIWDGINNTAIIN